jgi:hypothetical protein
MKYNFRIKIRILLVIAWVLTLAFFLLKLVVPSGEITYSSDFSKKTGFIYNLTPQERIDDFGDKVKIIADPVYFSLYYPRQFQEAEIKLKYKWENVDNQIMEMGFLADKNLWQYKLEPLENTILERAINTWHVSQEGNFMFLQKNKKFNSLNEFLQSDFSKNSTAVYNIDTKDLNISEFKLSQEKVDNISAYTIEQDLIGHHQFYMYHPGSDFNVNIKVQDLNQNDEEDNIEMFLFYQNQVIARESLDSIISLDSKEISELKDLSLELSDLSEGLYKVEIKISDDIVIKEIKTSSNKLSFINNIHLGESNDELKLYTDSSYLKVLTTKSASLQKLNFAGVNFDVVDTYKQHYFTSDTEVKSTWREINLKKGNLKLSNSGMFSFDKNLAFNPEMASLDDRSDLSNIDYIIADYKPVEKEGEWNVAVANFDLSSAYSEDNKYSFIFSLPNFFYKQNSALVIDSIDITLKGKNIWQKIKETIK